MVRLDHLVVPHSPADWHICFLCWVSARPEKVRTFWGVVFDARQLLLIIMLWQIERLANLVIQRKRVLLKVVSLIWNKLFGGMMHLWAARREGLLDSLRLQVFV